MQCRQAAVRPRARYDPSEDGQQRRTPTKPPHPSRMTHRALAQSRMSAMPPEGLDHFPAGTVSDHAMLVSDTLIPGLPAMKSPTPCDLHTKAVKI